MVLFKQVIFWDLKRNKMMFYNYTIAKTVMVCDFQLKNQSYECSRWYESCFNCVRVQGLVINIIKYLLVLD